MSRRPDIRVENSAPSQRKSAFAVRWASPILTEAGVRNVVDFGSGTLRNWPILERNFDEITLVETPIRCLALAPRIRGKNRIALFSTLQFEGDQGLYEAIFFISILHTIPDPRARQEMIRLANNKLRAGGFIVVDVPQSETYYNRCRKQLRRYKDGFLLRWGSHFTFYKSFYAEELDAMFEKQGNLILFKKIRYPKHLIRIWQKKRK